MRGEAFLRARVPVFAWLVSGLQDSAHRWLLLAWLLLAQTCMSHKRNSDSPRYTSRRALSQKYSGVRSTVRRRWFDGVCVAAVGTDSAPCLDIACHENRQKKDSGACEPIFDFN